MVAADREVQLSVHPGAAIEKEMTFEDALTKLAAVAPAAALSPYYYPREAGTD